jgi:methyl-accepting chemotaxis protein
MRYQDQVTATRLEPLYVAREALDQTGIAARNAYIFRDDADATRELALLDEQKAIYLSPAPAGAGMAGNAQFEKAKAGCWRWPKN